MADISKLPKSLYDQFYGVKEYIDEFEWDGETYPIRSIVVADGSEITVATSELGDTLHSGEWEDENEGFPSKEASDAWDEFWFFMDLNREIYCMTDYEVKCELIECTGTDPDFFFAGEELEKYLKEHKNK